MGAWRFGCVNAPFLISANVMPFRVAVSSTQQALVVRQQRLATDLALFGAAGLAHSPNQLDGRRCIHRKPCSFLRQRYSI